MREILFRGILKNDNLRYQKGQWVFGDLVRLQDGNDWKPHIYGYGEVFPKTVGQYTGFTDKNGKKIFEGDIVRTDKFSEPNKQYIVEYDLQLGAFIGQDKYNCYFVTFDGDSDEFEIIGNIHDNPELLEGGE